MGRIIAYSVSLTYNISETSLRNLLKRLRDVYEIHKEISEIFKQFLWNPYGILEEIFEMPEEYLWNP